MATVEVTIDIRVDPTGDGPGISGDAESLVSECFYAMAGTVEDVLVDAEEALRKAASVCEKRAETAYDERYAAPAPADPKLWTEP